MARGSVKLREAQRRLAPDRSNHFVHLDEDPSIPIGFLAFFLSEGLALENLSLVIATRAHLEKLEVELERAGVNVIAGGMAKVKRAIHAMGGLMGFESELGQGNEFWFILPRRHTADQAD